MPRRSGVPKRDVLPDPVYGSKVVTKLINQIMLDGKKGTAQTIVYEAFDIASKKLGAEALDIFSKALENAMPMLEVKARRVGGSTYQVPMEIPKSKREEWAARPTRSPWRSVRSAGRPSPSAGSFNLPESAAKRP